MTTRRRSPGRRRGSARPRTTWEQHALVFTLPPTGVLQFTDLTPTPLKSGDPRHGTAVLVRAIMSFKAVQQTASTLPQEFAFAAYVQTQAATTALQIMAPIAAVNDLQDWYYWTARSTFREGDVNTLESWEVDLRTKRRLRHGYGLVLVGEASASNLESISVTIGLRLLWVINN